MLCVFDSFDADETLDPLPPVRPLVVVLQLGQAGELQAALLAPVQHSTVQYSTVQLGQAGELLGPSPG